jgi:hypothetical protein
VAAYVGCVAGAVPIAEYERLLHVAGFTAVQVVDTRADLNVYAKIENQAGCCGSAGGCCEPAADAAKPPALHLELADLIARYDVNDYAASVRVYALKAAE